MVALRSAIALVGIGMLSLAYGQAGNNVRSPRKGSFIHGMASGTANALTPSTLYKQSVDMKLLVLSADGTEPTFAAMKFFLDHIGIPYDAVVLTTAGKLPALTDATHGLYQGILLATGSLGYASNGQWLSALSTADWATLDNYQINYGVRLVSYYTWPEARYGLAPVGAISTAPPSAAVKITYAAAAASVFPYLNIGNPLDVAPWAYIYTANAVAATGETTTPLLKINNYTVAATHTAADGRETLALTFDSNQYMNHALALNYGVFNWVTKGVFIGQRRVFLTPQSDDYFLSNDLYTTTPLACKPPGFNIDPTFDPNTTCPEARDVAADLKALVTWQRAWQAKAQTKGFRLTHAFNGYGTTDDYGTPANDSLLPTTKLYMNDFYWLNHTWDHENLDCYLPEPNSGICVPITRDDALDELQQNIDLAESIGLPNDTTSMVTPNISGLNNSAFLSAAASLGIKYMVSDMSYPIWLPALPNTGVRSPLAPSILYIPRHATNIFFNTKTKNLNAQGSLPDEYNYFFGPSGLLRLTGGAPFFTANQTYAQILDTESTTMLSYMLRGEWYPLMFHQANLIAYDGVHSLYSDVMDATLNKFMKISNLPVSSLRQTAIGQMMEERMAFNAAGVKATYVPGQGITLTAGASAKAPITGVCATNCTSYGSQNISMVPVAKGNSTLVPLY
jgi:hypothetical protein